ncbi:MAG: dihydroorotase [Candidatus Eisenbacteria bacterium]|nr:dihydroorotase [Candidatus Eisenbacteria bacterium]
MNMAQDEILIRGGRIIDPASGVDMVGDVLVSGGTIWKVGKKINHSRSAKVYDAGGLVVSPGFVDMHAHLREPGREDEETIESGAKAALKGGFTSIVAMPNTDPPIDSEGMVRLVIEKGEGAGAARVFPMAAITKGLKGESISEMAHLREAGAVAFTDDGNPVSNAGTMRRALEYASMLECPVVSHCEETSLTKGGAMNEGAVSTALGLKGIPSVAEEIIVARDILLSGFTGGRLHIAHMSTKESVDLIRRAKKMGTKVTAEATPHHIALTDELLRSYDTNFKMNPPLRKEDDRMALIEGLRDGTIDCIATDHAPHTEIEKDVAFDDAPFGVTGLETALGVLITFLVEAGHLTLEQMVEKLSLSPSKILGLSSGTLRPGAQADITVFDPHLEWTVSPDDFLSKSRNSPFCGMKLAGHAVLVLVSGRALYESSKERMAPRGNQPA